MKEFAQYYAICFTTPSPHLSLAHRFRVSALHPSVADDLAAGSECPVVDRYIRRDTIYLPESKKIHRD